MVAMQKKSRTYCDKTAVNYQRAARYTSATFIACALAVLPHKKCVTLFRFQINVRAPSAHTHRIKLHTYFQQHL